MLNRKLIHSGPRQTAVMAALVLIIITAALLLLLHQSAEAQGNERTTSNLALSSPNPGELSITWYAPSNAPDDYRVTWKKSTAKWTSYKDDNTVEGGNAFPTVTSHTVSNLEEGTAYKVRVRARYKNNDGKVKQSGPWSDSLEVTVSSQPPPPTAVPKGSDQPPRREPRSTNPPAKPTGLVLTASHDSVLLSWTDPGDDTITGYQILRGPDAASLVVLTDDTGNQNTSYTDDTVAAETTYVYAIKARNANGLSLQSDTVSATTPAAPPTKPVGLVPLPRHDSVALSWTDPSDSTITGYQILRGPDAASLVVQTDDTGNKNTSYSDDTVAAETTYVYAIKARNANGLSLQSDTVSTTTPAAPPAKPVDLLPAASHDSVLLFWTDPGDDTITGYQILRGPDAASLVVQTNDTGNKNTSYSDDTVAAETTYVYAIKARNANGLSLQSDTVSVKTLKAPPEEEEEETARQDQTGAITLTDGTARELRFERHEDEDDFNFTPTAGTAYRLSVQLISSANASVSIGRVFAGGEYLTSEVVRGGRAEVVFTPTQSGAAAIRVSGFHRTADEDGKYKCGSD